MTLTTIAYSPDASPLSDVPIRFEILEGEGVLESEEVRSDPEGFARNGVQLPRGPGTLLVRAVLPGPDAVETRFRVEVGPGEPREAVPFVGDGQAAPAGELLPEWIGVRVRDEFGNLVPNTLVRFRILEGGGEVRPTEVPTDDVGRAFARWTLGRSAGTQSLAAIVPGVADSLITFSATAEVPAEEDRPGADLANPNPPAAAPAIGDSAAVEPTGADAPSMTSGHPPAPTRIRVSGPSYAVGGSYVCAARRAAPPRCRGGIDSPRQILESERIFRALSAGVSHVCGLEEDGTAWCWGGNDAGQLGDGTTQDRPGGARIQTEARFSLLAAGVSHTCGLDLEGAATCWGRSLNGQLGNGSRSDRSFPTPVQGDLRFGSLASGWNHTCGTTDSGETYCWGLNRHGQLGDGTKIDRLNPVRVPGNFGSLTAGAQHTCGIGDTGALCWGDNSYGQTGSGEGSETHASPMSVSGLPSPPVSLAAGAVHTCALMEGGSAYCWGQNLHGQLGNGTNTNAYEPTAVVGNLRFRALFAGGAVTCGITDNGTEYCWGMNQGGQLGDGTRANRSAPVQVGGGPL